MNPSRILFVEDHQFNREVITEYLELQGYQVCALSDGSNFFPSIKSFQPNLLLLDLKLSQGVDGFTLMRQLQRSAWHQIPIIVLSALCFNRDKKLAFQLGARRFLVKPIALKILQQAIQEELEINFKEPEHLLRFGA